MRNVAPARAAAFDILFNMDSGPAHSDTLLRGRGMDALSQQDRNLATTLVMGILRWQIALDAQTLKLLDRPDTSLNKEVQIALRMGAFQLLHLDRIPPHAAISESVELAKRAGLEHVAPMVNAILRKIAAMREAGGKPAEQAIRTPSDLSLIHISRRRSCSPILRWSGSAGSRLCRSPTRSGNGCWAEGVGHRSPAAGSQMLWVQPLGLEPA